MFWHWGEAIERLQTYVAAHQLSLKEELRLRTRIRPARPQRVVEFPMLARRPDLDCC